MDSGCSVTPGPKHHLLVRQLVPDLSPSPAPNISNHSACLSLFILLGNTSKLPTAPDEHKLLIWPESTNSNTSPLSLLKPQDSHPLLCSSTSADPLDGSALPPAPVHPKLPPKLELGWGLCLFTPLHCDSFSPSTVAHRHLV